MHSFRSMLSESGGSRTRFPSEEDGLVGGRASTHLWIAVRGAPARNGGTPGRAIDFAEVELFGYSVSRSGASANFGFPADSLDLVSSNDTETPLDLHGDHDGAAFVRDRFYRDAERVNTSRSVGGNGPVRGTIEAGHSISVTTGYADAASNELGGWAEASAGSLGSADAAGTTSMRIEKRITILPVASGLAAGAPVIGLRWVIDGHGTLEVGGRSFPNDSAASASVGFDILMLRGPTGTCGAFDCPHGALAISLDLLTSLAVTGLDPELADGRTARVTRHDTWTASNNTGVFKAGGIFDSGTTEVELGLPITDEDVAVVRVDGVDTGAEPLGHVFESSVPVPEPGVDGAGALAVALLALWRIRAARHP